MKKKFSRKWIWITGTISLFVIVIVFYLSNFLSMGSDCTAECIGKFKEWCIKNHLYHYPYQLPSDIANCMTKCSPFNTSLPQDKTYTSMQYICEAFGTE